MMLDVPRMQLDDAKQNAAREAVRFLPEAGVLGLGTGTTAKFFIDEVGAGVRSGRRWVGVPTSERSRLQAEALGIPLLAQDGPWDIDVTVDGADEVDASLNLIKGGGAAHSREKIINFASRRNIIVVTEDKLSSRLGERSPVPVEVMRFGHAQTGRLLGTLGRPVLREMRDGPLVTDGGNYIYDLHTGPIDAPEQLEADLMTVPGVVMSGLFVGRADSVVVASSSGGVRRLDRAAVQR